MRRVVITGIGVLTPIGKSKNTFVKALKEGRSGVAPITLFDTSKHRYKLAAEVKELNPEKFFERKDLRRMDRASQMILIAAREAVADANLDFGNEDANRCGVFLGTTLGGMISGEKYHRMAQRNKLRLSLLLDFAPHAIADRVAIAYKLQGASSIFSTACASGGHSIAYAFDTLCQQKADVMLAGGVDTVAEFTQAGFGSLQTLITGDDQIRPFDKNRRGFALGEGAAILVLETEAHAQARGAKIYCEFGGYGVSSDAQHMTAPDKEGKGAAAAMLSALKHADEPKENIDYINAHGTATKYNDLMETRAIKRAFGSHAYQLNISSTKSMIGHTLGAAGSIELAATALAMNHGFLPPTIGYETPDPECDLNYVPNESRPGRIRAALSNSFGFGGANISILIRESKTARIHSDPH